MDQFPVMVYPQKVIRDTAGKITAGRIMVFTGACALFLCLTEIVPAIFTYFVQMGQFTQTMPGTNITLRYSVIANLYKVFMQGAFSCGLMHFFLAAFRMKNESFSSLFNGFSCYWKCLLLDIIISAVTSVGMFLFLFPGFIFYYQYSQAFYILAESPGKGVMQCLRESTFLMRRNKWWLFVLDLTYLPWFIPYMVASAAYAYFNMDGDVTTAFVLFIVSVVCEALALAKCQAGRTVFFDVITGHLKIYPEKISPGQISSGNGGSDFGV